MVKCEYCNSNVDESLGTCPHCGAPLPTASASSTTADAEETVTENTEKEETTTGSILGGLASVLLDSKRKTPAPPRPTYRPQRQMPPEGDHRLPRDIIHEGPERRHIPHDQGRGPHR